ncbi:MAG: oligosaccharide flippase family protein [Candidatus Erginobacter occultus]|nr:oligosaccharide flippase family protein [Candidatus Erginobacter occultus]
MSEIKRLTGNTAALILSRGVRLLLSMAIGVVLARYLGDLHYGNWSVARSLAALLTILCSLGMSQIAIRECSPRPREIGRYLGTVLIIQVFLSAGSVLAALVLVYGLGYRAEIAWLVFIALGIYLLSSIGSNFIIQFRSREKMGYEALANSVKDLALMLLVFFAVYLGWGVVRIAFLYLLATAGFVVFAWYLAVKKFPGTRLRFDRGLVGLLIVGGLPIGLAVFFNSFHEVTRIVLQKTVGSPGAGQYSVATLPYLALESTVIIAIMGAIFPLLSRLYRSDRDRLVKITRTLSRYFYILSLLLVLYCFFLGDELILLLFGEQYLDAIPVFKLLGLVILLMPQNYLLFNAMVASRKEWLFALVVGAAALLNGAGAYIFSSLFSRFSPVPVIGSYGPGSGIRLIGVAGGPVALFAAQLFLLAALSAILRREYRRGLLARNLWRPVLAAAVTGGLVRWQGILDFPPGVVLATSAVVYGVLLYGLGTITEGDRIIFRQLLSTLPFPARRPEGG